MNTVIIGAVVILSGLFGYHYYSTHSVKEPRYRVINKTESIEIRQYEPKIIAQVTVTGKRSTAINKGFRLLADYIFGNNSVPNQASSKIAMTAPVMQSPATKIAMTAPVSQSKLTRDEWLVSFVMPEKYTLKSLPQPNNKAINIIQQAPGRYIVIKFSGRMTGSNLGKHLETLNTYVKGHNVNTIGEPIYAFYNAPWTLPFLRRNEIMYQLKS
jgi:hypothetical protein